MNQSPTFSSPGFCLLMTACIAPQPAKKDSYSLKRIDPTLRLDDYKKALAFWLAYPDDRIKGIVFVENSGYPLDALRDLANSENKFNRKVEFLQYPPKEVPEGLHYGYAELEMMDAAIDQSELLKESEWLIKTTGRLYFPKLSYLIDFAITKPECRVVTDSRDFKIGPKEQHYIVTTLMLIQVSLYKELLYDAKSKMTKDYCSLMEHLYFALLKPYYLANPRKAVLRFPFNSDPVGVGAHANVDYSSFKKKMMSGFRSVSRKLLPKFWI